MIYPCANLNRPRIFIGRIPKGYAGTRKTVELIAHLVREGAKDFRVRQTAIDILIQHDVRPKDYLGEIRALFECWTKVRS